MTAMPEDYGFNIPIYSREVEAEANWFAMRSIPYGVDKAVILT